MWRVQVIEAKIMRRPARAIMIALIVVSVIFVAGIVKILADGPSVGEVRDWCKALPAGADANQVHAFFASKGIVDGGVGEMSDKSGRLYMRGYIYCEGDRAIAIGVVMTPDGHMIETFVDEGYRGL